MATKNLVPRGDAEGKLGLSSRRWLEINAVSGSFPTVITNSLKNFNDLDLLKAGDGIVITEDAENSQIIISSSGSNTAESDRIFEGEAGSETIVETIKSDTESKITFTISGDEKWLINSEGDMLPSNNRLQSLGGFLNSIKNIYINEDALIFRKTGFSNTRLNVSNSYKLQFGKINSSQGYDYEDVLVAKEDVRLASTENDDLTSLTLNPNDANQILWGTETTASLDGVSLVNGDNVLIKDHANELLNGIYTVSGVGDSIILERVVTLRNNVNFSNLKVTVLEGTENGQQIFFTVPDVDINGTVGTSTGSDSMKWVQISGGGTGGLESVFDDKAPVLGGDITVGGFDIISSNSSINLITEKGTQNAAGLSLNSQLGTSNITLKSNNYPPVLNFETPDKKFIKIAGVSNLFFTSQNIVGQTFEYAFKDNLTTDEITASRAYFATQGWVESQGYVTTSPDLSNYVVNSTDSTPSLGSITILNEPASQQSWTDANVVTKGYVDSVLQGIDEVLEPVRAATDQNIDLTNGLESGDTINDGTITLAAGDRILVKNQTTASENGVYVVQATGAAVRSTDLANSASANAVFVFAEEGSNASTGFLCTSPSGSDVVGTNDLTFVKMSSATEVTVSSASGLTKNGNALSVNVDDVTLQITTNTLSIKNMPSTSLDVSGFTSSLDILSDNDLFIVSDNSDSNSTKKSEASLIKNYIRTDVTSATGDVHFSLPVTPATVMSVEAQSALITNKSENLDGSNNPVALDDSDYLLYSDASDSNNLKKVAYSTIKNNIATSSSFNISSFNEISASSVTDDDTIAIYDNSESAHQKLTFASLKNIVSSKLKYFFSNAATVTIDSSNITANTHIILELTAPGTQEIDLTSVTGQSGDIIKISALPSNQVYSRDGGDQYHHTKNISVIVNANTFTYGIKDLTKPIEFIYRNGWKSYVSRFDGNVFNSPLTNTVMLDAFGSSDQVYKWNSIVCSANVKDIEFNFISASLAESVGILKGDTREIYFSGHLVENIKITSTNSLYTGSLGGDWRFGANTLTFNFEASTKIKKVIFKLIDIGGTLLWDVQSPQALISESGSLPAGSANDILKYDASSTLVSGKIIGANITDGTISGSKIATGEITGGANAGGTAATGNIALNTVSTENLKQITNYHVLGAADFNENANATNINVSEVEVVHSSWNGSGLASNEINTSKDSRLATAAAIKQYVAEQLDSIPVEPFLSPTSVRQVSASINSVDMSNIYLTSENPISGSIQLLTEDAEAGVEITTVGDFVRNYFYVNDEKGHSILYNTLRKYYNPKNTYPKACLGTNIISSNTNLKNNWLYNKSNGINKVRVFLPPAEEFFNLYGSSKTINIVLKYPQSLQNSSSIDARYAFESGGIILLPHPDDFQYTKDYMDTATNNGQIGNILNQNEKPTFILLDDNFQGWLTKHNTIPEIGFAGCWKARNYYHAITQAFQERTRNGAQFIYPNLPMKFSASVNLVTNASVYNIAGQYEEAYKLVNELQEKSYFWKIEYKGTL